MASVCAADATSASGAAPSKDVAASSKDARAGYSGVMTTVTSGAAGSAGGTTTGTGAASSKAVTALSKDGSAPTADDKAGAAKVKKRKRPASANGQTKRSKKAATKAACAAPGADTAGGGGEAGQQTQPAPKRRRPHVKDTRKRAPRRKKGVIVDRGIAPMSLHQEQAWHAEVAQRRNENAIMRRLCWKLDRRAALRAQGLPVFDADADANAFVSQFQTTTWKPFSPHTVGTSNLLNVEASAGRRSFSRKAMADLALATLGIPDENKAAGPIAAAVTAAAAAPVPASEPAAESEPDFDVMNGDDYGYSSEDERWRQAWHERKLHRRGAVQPILRNGAVTAATELDLSQVVFPPRHPDPFGAALGRRSGLSAASRTATGASEAAEASAAPTDPWAIAIVDSADSAGLLDRYAAGRKRGGRSDAVAMPASSFRALLEGEDDAVRESPLTSPYSGRKLPPFIWRDRWSAFPRVALHAQLLTVIANRQQRRGGEAHAPVQHQRVCALNYAFIRPWHMAQVNRLLADQFWPGIDMAEALTYPEFGVVAVYRRLVVAAAFITPHGYVTYIATRPGWRGCGIASLLLYHLMQMCPGRDITLHVSVTNPALMLYQRFGFKPEEFVVNFYSKYLPASSPLSRHAFFLRSRR